VSHTPQNALFVKRIAPLAIGFFLVTAACGALCQSSLPDAPSYVASSEKDRFKTIADEARPPLATGAVGVNPSVLRATETTHLTPEVPLTVSALSKDVARRQNPNDFFSKYLNASRQQNSHYEPSSGGKVMTRAGDAASRIFLMRTPSGNARLNAPYFLRVLTSVAAASASRRYRARSGTAPLADFGSTVGNDAGMNLLHEFGPGIRQKMAGHLPEFVSRIGERISRSPSRR